MEVCEIEVNSFPIIKSAINSYNTEVQGKANEPICVKGLLDQAHQYLEYVNIKTDWELETIVERLDANHARIAIIGGSSDHPAHIRDLHTVYITALEIWRNGGVPFYFSVPVMCDGTAQSTQGMSYSLQSRNAITEIVVNQLESHHYHGAFVIQSCDKQPLALVAALAHLDRLRQNRGEAPFFATFAPAHVLRGGAIPTDVQRQLEEIGIRAEEAGFPEIARDLRDTMGYILQCSSNTSFQGVFTRAVRKGIISSQAQKQLEKKLAAASCHCDGGICAFNGTGNSSRHLVAGLGLVHPAIELLTAPPTVHQIQKVVSDLGTMINKSEFGVANIMASNISNAIRIYSAAGGSTNLTIHIVAAMVYGGFKFNLASLESILRSHPIPDLFNYSLTESRDIFVLATQVQRGDHRGIETLFASLLKNGVPMELDAPTVTGGSWRHRLTNTNNLYVRDDQENPIILEKPRRDFSGVNVLSGNFFTSAVVKMSGLDSQQIESLDNSLAFVLYFENEDDANRSLLNSQLVTELKQRRQFDHKDMLALVGHNCPDKLKKVVDADYNSLFDQMITCGALKIVIVIAGQGPAAFGMPEMFTPMQHINANRALQKLVTVVSDGRYSGVTYGAAIGHVTPEAKNKGGILYLQSGDILHIDLCKQQINMVDKNQLHQGLLAYRFSAIKVERETIGEQRVKNMQKRQRLIAASNRMNGCTDASLGVVPQIVFDEADLDHRKDIQLIHKERPQAN